MCLKNEQKIKDYLQNLKIPRQLLQTDLLEIIRGNNEFSTDNPETTCSEQFTTGQVLVKDELEINYNGLKHEIAEFADENIENPYKEYKPFKCKICKKHFKYQCYLTYHLKMHTAVRPFKCDVCEKSFLLKGM